MRGRRRGESRAEQRGSGAQLAGGQVFLFRAQLIWLSVGVNAVVVKRSDSKGNRQTRRRQAGSKRGRKENGRRKRIGRREREE